MKAFVNFAAAAASTVLVDDVAYWVAGNTAYGDSGAGWFVFDDSSSATGGINVIVVTAGGRLLRVTDSDGGLSSQETADAGGLTPASVASGSLVDKITDVEAAITGGTFWQATQPVSLATSPALVAGSALIGKVGIDQTTPGTTNKVSIGTDGTVAVSGSVGVTGTFWQATQPVSGTVTANIGTGTLAAVTTVSTVSAVTAITNALPAGTNAIGKLAANSGVNIGTVTLSAIPALVAGSAAIGKLAANAGVNIGDVAVVSGRETTVTPSQVSMTAATSTTLLSASASRIRFIIYNPTAAVMYIRKAASAASATAFDIVIPAGLSYFSDAYEYAGEIRGFSTPGGTANVSQSV